MEPLKDLLKKHIQRSGIEKQVVASQVLDQYSESIKNIFGESILDKAQPLYLKNKVLTVACISSVVAQELRFRENEIFRQLHKDVIEEIVREIKYTI